MTRTKKQQIADATYTYCNPLSIPDIPYGDDERMIQTPRLMYNDFNHEPKEAEDYRSISDPTVMYYDNKWYLYPSYGMAWVSEDFRTWKHVRTNPYCPKYSPCITKWKDKFLLTSWNCPLYVSDNPLGPFELMGEFIMPDGKTFVPCDPAIFTDDDGRIYLYAFGIEKREGKGIFCSKIIGYELDTEDPRKVVQGPVTIFSMNPEEHPWERYGFHNQDKRFGYVEGPHMLKYHGRYYCIYGTPDTNNANYCLAAYYSDEGPLSGFVCQKRNPILANKCGIVGGAGHGCVERGPGDTLWAFYTVSVANHHQYERRIGMDLVVLDENGELYCPHGVTETPQFIPGYVEHPEICNSPEYLPLNVRYRPTVSSSTPGRGPLYATDGSSITYWEPEENDENPTITCNLKVPYYVGAVRLFWHEKGLCYRDGIVPGPIHYVLEGCCDDTWIPLFDNKEETVDYNIDYRTFTPVSCEQVRLKLIDWPEGIHPGVIDFTVFGTRDMQR